LHVIINAAMTLDGKIATVIGDSKMSSMQDLVRVHNLRASVDAIIVGISTVLADNPRLTARFVKVKQKKHPSRIIVDSTARIPLDSRILRSASRIETIVVVTKRADPDKILKIKKSGASVLIAGLRRVDLKETFVFLEKAGYKKILVEGGGSLNWSLLRIGVIDELIITISPRIVGGVRATTLVEGKGFERISEGIKLELVKVAKQENGEVVLSYKL